MQTLPPELDHRLTLLRDVVLDENTRVNLTALRDPEACRIGNILDSLAFLDIVERLEQPRTLLDIGTGGGFPLLPIALALPDLRCTGLDSTGKKIEAIRRIAQKLNLTNVDLVTARAENAAHDPVHRAQADVVTARAVADTAVLLEYAAAFARVGGFIVLWKSMHAQDELAQSAAAQRTVRASLAFTHTYELPGDFGQRQLIVFRKDAPTPNTYPRPIGVPSKTPLH